MKRYTYITFLILALITNSLGAENRNSNDNARKQLWEDMKAKRAAYYSERIGLTADEAQVFWPVYNELQNKKDKLHRAMSDQFRNAKKDINGRKVFDFTKATDDMINLRLQDATLDKTYHAKFKRILSPEKLFRYYDAERNWANHLLKNIEKRGDRK
jgi:hypothetical protein